MTIQSKYKYIIAGVLIIVAFATGRYSNRVGEVTAQTYTQKNTVENKTDDTRIETVIVTTKAPDGTVKQVKTINQVLDVKTVTDTKEDSKTVSATYPPWSDTLNVSVLVANDFSRGLLAPTYGISVNKEILGPITVGGFGLLNGTIGVSIGLNF